MYRTNAQSRLLEEAFLQAGMPYKLVGAQRFYGRREIKDVIAYLRVVHNPKDEISLTRVINVPPRGIGNKTFLSLRTQAQKREPVAGDAADRAGRRGIPRVPGSSRRAGQMALFNFGSLLANWMAQKEALPPLSFDGPDPGRDGLPYLYR